MENNRIEIKDIDLNIARKINKEIALEEKILPVKIKKDTLIVIGVKINEKIEEYLNFMFSMKIYLIKMNIEIIENIIIGVFSGESPNLHESFIERAIELKASDIHIEPIENDVYIRIRTDGKLSLDRKIKTDEYNILLSKIKIKANMDITEKSRYKVVSSLFTRF